jgi:hypothetical protein
MFLPEHAGDEGSAKEQQRPEDKKLGRSYPVSANSAQHGR